MGVQVSGVYLSTGDTVVNRKAYLWEFEYLVRIKAKGTTVGNKKRNVYLYVEQVLLSFIPSYKSLENSLIMNRRLIASYRVLSSVKIQAG